MRVSDKTLILILIVFFFQKKNQVILNLSNSQSNLAHRRRLILLMLISVNFKDECIFRNVNSHKYTLCSKCFQLSIMTSGLQIFKCNSSPYISQIRDQAQPPFLEVSHESYHGCSSRTCQRNTSAEDLTPKAHQYAHLSFIP